MTPVALALSPHLDDAAFSCGGTLATLAARGWRVVIATLFTASVPNPTGFALACQTDKGFSAELDYMALRRAEDAAACGALGADAAWLPFAEAPHRGYASAAALFGPASAADDIGRELATAIASLVDDLRPDLVLAPQAIGGHVDHVQTVLALAAVDLSIPILWWRDFPYTVRTATPPEPFGDRMASLPELAMGLDKAALAKRQTACLAYASQLGFQFGGSDELVRRLGEAGGVERLRAQGRMPAAFRGAFDRAA